MTYNLVEIQKRQESTDKFVQKVGKTLWHYTSFPALDGILRKKEIWFGSATNRNRKTLFLYMTYKKWDYKR